METYIYNKNIIEEIIIIEAINTSIIEEINATKYCINKLLLNIY